MSTNQQPVTPKHTHYVSNHNDAIYPAMTSPAGYEDEHPTEYRPATAQEVERYKNGAETVKPLELSGDVLSQLASGGAAQPATIKLADDPEPEQEAAVIPPAAPPAAPAPTFAIPPAPAPKTE